MAKRITICIDVEDDDEQEAMLRVALLQEGLKWDGTYLNFDVAIDKAKDEEAVP